MKSEPSPVFDPAQNNAIGTKTETSANLSHDKELDLLRVNCQSLNEELNMLAYAISHDLEQPLRHIMAYSKLLSRKIEDHEDPDIQKFAEFIQSAGVILDARITAILEYSRLSQHPVKLSQVNSETQILRIFTKYKVEADMRNLAFQHMNLPVLQTDPDLFELIFHELLKNALYFTSQSPSPSISLNGQKTPHQIIISVCDNGVGLGNYSLDRMVKLFQQGQHDLPKLPTSHGTGLAMVQRALNKLNGQLTHSVSESGHTCFKVHFPA